MKEKRRVRYFADQYQANSSYLIVYTWSSLPLVRFGSLRSVLPGASHFGFVCLSTFYRNHGTAVLLRHSYLELYGGNSFEGNRGINGGALSLTENSIMHVSGHTHTFYQSGI